MVKNVKEMNGSGGSGDVWMRSADRVGYARRGKVEATESVRAVKPGHDSRRL